jgi:hypothetical protein
VAAKAIQSPGMKPNPRMFSVPNPGQSQHRESANFATMEIQEKCSFTFDMRLFSLQATVRESNLIREPEI